MQSPEASFRAAQTDRSAQIAREKSLSIWGERASIAGNGTAEQQRRVDGMGPTRIAAGRRRIQGEKRARNCYLSQNGKEFVSFIMKFLKSNRFSTATKIGKKSLKIFLRRRHIFIDNIITPS